MFFGGSTAARRARRPGRASAPGAGRPQARTVALVCAAVTGTGLVTLGTVAWTTPTTVTVAHPVQIQQRAVMTYDARAPRSAAYPTGRVRTADPVFLRLVPTMDVRIAYQAQPDGPGSDGTRQRAGDSQAGTTPAVAGLSGTRRVTAELRSSNGWHRGFELLARAGFTGGGFDVIAPIDLKHVRSLVTGVETATGIDDETYTLSVRSEIALNGRIPGRPTSTAVRDGFFPELTFSYDGKQLKLAETTALPAVGSTPGSGPGPSPITEVIRSRSTTVQVAGTEANHLSVLGPELPVGPARIGALAAGLVLLAAAGFAERSRRAARRAGPDRIVRRIVLDASGSAKPTTSATRSRVPGPRTAALAERQWARTHPGTHERD